MTRSLEPGNSDRTGGVCSTANVVDLVGYGSNANLFEGSGPTPSMGGTDNSVQRRNRGCIDTDDNAADFESLEVDPRNGASAAIDCTNLPPPPDAGFSLPVIYAVWFGVILVLYLPCAWFASVKKRSRSVWLSYL